MNFAQKAGISILLIGGGVAIGFGIFGIKKVGAIRANNPTTTIMPGAVDGNTNVQLDQDGNNVIIYFDANYGAGSMAAARLRITNAATGALIAELNPGHGYSLPSSPDAAINYSLTVFYNGAQRFTNLGSTLDVDNLYGPPYRRAVFNGVFSTINASGVNLDYVSLTVGDAWKLVHPNN